MEDRPRKERTGYLYKRTADGEQVPAGDHRPGTYYLQYDVAGRRRRVSLGVTSLEDAEKERKRIMAPLMVADKKEAISAMKQRVAVAEGKVQEIDAQRTPPLEIEQAWQVFLGMPTRPDSGPRTLSGYESQWDLFVEWIKREYPLLKRLAGVDSKIAQEYARYLLSEIKITVHRKRRKREWDEEKIIKRAFTSNTYNKHARVLEMVFRVLAERAGITSNPWSGLSRKTERKESRRELTVAELNTICNRATGDLQALLVLGIYTGLRLGDCCTLRWSEVDLVRRIILRVANKTARQKKGPVHIPIHPTLFTYLNQIPVGKRNGFVLPEYAERYRDDDSSIAKEIRRFFIKCGIQVHKDDTGKGTGTRAVVEVGFHSLRHSFVSLCRQANAPLAVVEAIVGHSNPAMTRHYTHISETAAAGAVAALPSLLESKTKKAIPSHVSDIKREDFSHRDTEMIAVIKQSTARTWEKDCEHLLQLLYGG
jgi:integrase